MPKRSYCVAPRSNLRRRRDSDALSIEDARQIGHCNWTWCGNTKGGRPAGRCPATGLCPVPRGGSAPATRKNLPYEGGNLKQSCPSRWSGSNYTLRVSIMALGYISFAFGGPTSVREKSKLEQQPAQSHKQEERSVIHLDLVYPISGSSCIGNDS